MLGEQIKRLRVANGISQVELALNLEVSKQSVSNWENNNIMPSIDMLKKICQFFSCSADYLLEISEGDRLIFNTSDLSAKQTAHIRQLVDDYCNLNREIAKTQANVADLELALEMAANESV